VQGRGRHQTLVQHGFVHIADSQGPEQLQSENNGFPSLAAASPAEGRLPLRDRSSAASSHRQQSHRMSPKTCAQYTRGRVKPNPAGEILIFPFIHRALDPSNKTVLFYFSA